MTWDENVVEHAAPPRTRTEPIDLDALSDGRCVASSWRGPRGRGTYENHFGPGGFNRCVGTEGHANPLHKSEWGHVFQVDPFRVVRTEAPVDMPPPPLVMEVEPGTEPVFDRERLVASLRKDMAGAARSLLGSGYVDDYYESCASDFVMIAEHAVDEVLRGDWTVRP